MRTKRTLYPGQAGTKKWVQKYGDQLICVRYKYDAQLCQKMITVELVEEKSAWHKKENYIPKNKIVMLRIDYGEIDLAMKVKSFGGKWNRKERAWELRFDAVQALGLEDRIVGERRLRNESKKQPS
ncbi:hypothetical protein Calab_1039 [Caldithrix abyssi DSM 13497]|uniref:Uncharacterized protein n=2 Tax=Caldithrix abyssi DSM 13497 TaxID=880073 RepID=H1XVU5_CALAY|nr:hypothetical protein [Caldithrix abyssi]EHO40672.1 hypothetical protein Calab_1039 [Caldithrix abyssi DSM 13497]